MKFLENMVQDNLLLAVLITHSAYDCKLCRSSTSGVTFDKLRGWYLDRYLERSVAQLRQRLEQWLHFLWDDFSFQDSIKPMAMKNKYLKKMAV